MKWVLLLGLVVGLAKGRTIFDYERDGLDNEQRGIPGKSVTGEYEWRAPDGKVTEVSYIADHLGFRLLEDLELQPPTNSFYPGPAESTAQASTKTAETGNVRAMEEEGEEEEEEENETLEGETEEEEEEEETEEEEAEGESAGQEERVAEEEEEEQQTTEAKTAEVEGAQSTKAEENEAEGAKSAKAEEDKAEGAQSAKAEEKEADATMNEKDSQANENTGKSLDQAPASEQETADAKEGADAPQEKSAADSPNTVEAKTAAVPASVLVPVKVESVATVEGSDVLEPTFVEMTPVIAIAEIMPIAEPMVAPIQEISSDFTSVKQMQPLDDVVVVGEGITDTVVFPDFAASAPEARITDTVVLPDYTVSAPEALPLVDDQQTMSSSVDTVNAPSAFSGAAIVFLGPFPSEGQESSQNFEAQSAFEREPRTITADNQDQQLSSDPISKPSVEVEFMAVPIATVPRAEPLLQPVVEVSLTHEDEQKFISISEVAEVPSSPEMASLSAFEKPSSEPLIVAQHIEVPETRYIENEPELSIPSQNFVNEVPQAVSAFELQDVPRAPVFAFSNDMPQQTEQMQDVPSAPVFAFSNDMPQQTEQMQVIQEPQEFPVNTFPLPSPLSQVQILEFDVSPRSDNRPIETNPNLEQNPTVFVSEIEVSEANNAPDIYQIASSPMEIQPPQHRFDVTKSGRSMDSAPVLVENTENYSMKDLYFIPESFQVSDSKSAFQVVEVPVPQEEMIIKAKAFTQAENSLDLEFVGVSTNELEKPISKFSDPSSDSVNHVPFKMSAFADPNPTPLQVEVAFVPEQGDTFQEPDVMDSISVPVQFVEVPVSAFDIPEPEPFTAAEVAPLDSAPAAPAYPQLDGTFIPFEEELSTGPERVVLFEIAEPSPAVAPVRSEAPLQEPPLLPPMMKVSRILNYNS